MRCHVSDGLHIRWRETAPDRGLLSFALAELDALHSTWPETLQCNIVVERAPVLALAPEGALRSLSESEPRYQMNVELDLGHRAPRVKAHALGCDLYTAISRAFSEIKLT